ncbi:MAG: TolC family protein [Bacteroidaceae bacterium]|nr:TolC family protein [Bacteroidaceae bacterium]
MKNKYLLLIATVLIPAFTGVKAQQRLSLDNCLDSAIVNNATIKNAKISQQQAAEMKKEVITNYFPSVQALAFGFKASDPFINVGVEAIENAAIRNAVNTLYNTYGRYLGIDNRFTELQNGYMAAGIVTQPIYAGGRITNGNRLAKLGKEVSALQSEITQRDVLLDVEENYWLTVSLNEKANTVNKAIELLDTLTHDVELAQKAGIATDNDALKVRLKKGDMQVNKVKLENGIKLSTMNLCRISGIQYSEDICLEDRINANSLPSPEQIKFYGSSKSVAARPEAQLLDLQVSANRLQKKLTLGEALPQMAIGGMFTYGRMMERFEQNPRYNMLGFATISIPMTDWWKKSHTLKRQQYEIEKAQIQKDDTMNQMELQNLQCWNTVVETWEIMGVAKLNAQDAEENLNQTRISFKAGLATTAEVLEAHTTSINANEELTQAQINYLMAIKHYEALVK